MKLIIGGRSNGKYDFVKTLGYSDDEIKTDINSKVVYRLNEIVAKLLEEDNYNREDVIEKICKSKCEIVVIDEVGSGIVPIEKKQRYYREEVGRLSCVIATLSEEVIRVFAGVGVKIK